MQDFTPMSSLAGGVLIGLAASLLLIGSGRVAGISGIVGGLLLSAPGERRWRAWFVAGLLAAGVVFAIARPSAIGASPNSIPLLAVAGLLVGVGTRLGSGCTSGHGVCGVSRWSPRSLAATVAFVAAGMFTVALVRWLGGVQ
jgi:hypothetical protein